MEALYFAPKITNLLGFVYLLLVLHVLLDLLNLFKSPIHLVFVVLSDVFPQLLQLVFKLGLGWLFFYGWLGLIDLCIFKSLRLLLLELVHEYLDLLLIATDFFKNGVALKVRSLILGSPFSCCI